MARNGSDEKNPALELARQWSRGFARARLLRLRSPRPSRARAADGLRLLRRNREPGLLLRAGGPRRTVGAQRLDPDARHLADFVPVGRPERPPAEPRRRPVLPQ